MDVLAINGSPHMNEGNTAKILNPFLEGLKEAGANVELIYSWKLNIEPCSGDMSCWFVNPGTCAKDDDMKTILPKIKNADVIVFVSPLYWFGMSSHIKAAIDRMYAYDRENRKTSLRIKEGLLFVCGACEGMEIFEGIIASYKGILNYMKWQNSGILAVPGVSDKGDILKSDAMEKAEQLGRSI